MTIAKVDAADSTTPIPGTTFTIEGIDSDYRNDVTTGEDGTVSLRVAPGSYKVIEQSVPAPYYLPDKDADREQTVSLNAGDEKRLVFENHKAPELTIYKEDSVAGAPVEGARFHVTYTSNGEASDAQHFQIPWAQIRIVCAALVMALGMGGLCSGGARSGGEQWCRRKSSGR